MNNDIDRVREIIDALGRAKLTSAATKKLLAELKTLVGENEEAAAVVRRHLVQAPSLLLKVPVVGKAAMVIGIIGIGASAGYKRYKQLKSV